MLGLLKAAYLFKKERCSILFYDGLCSNIYLFNMHLSSSSSTGGSAVIQVMILPKVGGSGKSIAGFTFFYLADAILSIPLFPTPKSYWEPEVTIPPLLADWMKIRF